MYQNNPDRFQNVRRLITQRTNQIALTPNFKVESRRLQQSVIDAKMKIKFHQENIMKFYLVE